ncbi:MAG TPA: hypothetical protein VGR10_03510 [Thermoleophilaceae bacterium]|nr:hypothetical protein [Thermoleophilaceae bacterium]
MISAALNTPKRMVRAPAHVAAWLVWHSMRVSLMADLSAPHPPRGE